MVPRGVPGVLGASWGVRAGSWVISAESGRPGASRERPADPPPVRGEQIGFSIWVDYFPSEAGFGIPGSRFQKPGGA